MSGSDTYLPTTASGGASSSKFTLPPAKFVPPPPKGGGLGTYGITLEVNMDDGTEENRKGKQAAGEVPVGVRR